MKTHFWSVFISLILFGGNDISVFAQGWTQLDDFPSSARDDGTSFTINLTTYCGTGLDGAWNPTNDFYAFDMSLESWTTSAGLPQVEARQYASGFTSTTHGYVFGGVNGSGFLNDLWKYDPISDSWSEVSALPALGRSGTSRIVMGDTAYIIGGRTSSALSIAEVWAYSMTSDTWTQKNNLPESLWRASAIAFQGKGYLVFGLNNAGLYKNEIYEYDPTNDSWSNLANFPGVGRTYVSIYLLDDQIVLLAGRDSIGNSYNDMWKFDVLANSWSISYNLPASQRRGGMCFHSNSAIYYTTGIDFNNSRLTETWKYDLFLSENETDMDAFSMYPNPATIELNIQLKNGFDDSHYRIYSLTGQILQSAKLETTQRIDIAELAPGNYLIELQSAEKKQTKRFVIN